MKILNRIKTNSNVPLIISILIGFLIGAVILLFAGINPFDLLNAMFNNSFKNTRRIMLFIQEFGLLLLLGLAAFFSLKVGFFNLGAPGQMVFAGMCASMFALHTHMSGALHVTLTTLVAIGSAIAYSLLAGLMKMFFGINDIVATVLLNWIAMYVLQAIFFNTTVLSPNGLIPGRTTPETPKIPSSSDWILESVLQKPAVFTTTIVVASAALIISYVVIKRTRFGFKLNMIGKNERASYIAGYNTKKITIISIIISGLLIGLFTMGYYFGKHTTMSEVQASYPPALGFNGLILYIMAGKSIIGLIFSALLMNFLQGPGSEGLIGFPASMSQIFAASIIYCIAIVRLFENWWDIKGYFKNKVRQIKNLKNYKMNLSFLNKKQPSNGGGK